MRQLNMKAQDAQCAQRTAQYANSLKSISTYKRCVIVSALPTANFDGKLFTDKDCHDAACMDVVHSLKGNFNGCSLTDTGTGQNVEMAKLESYCAGITATWPPGDGSRPSLPPIPTADQQTNYQPTTESQVKGSYAPPSGSNIGVIIGAIAAVAIVAIIASAYVYLRLKKHAAKHSFIYTMPPPNTNGDPYASVLKSSTASQSNTRTNESSGSEPSDGALDLCNLEMFRIAPKEISMVKSLAQGAYGEVWLGQFEGQMVAVKKLLNHRRNLDELQKFIYEIALMSKMESAYIVQFIGVAWSRPTDIMLVTEFMDAGDLRNFLYSNQVMQWNQKIQIALDIAEGLVYLHTLDPRVIHRDLKSRNVLLNSKQQTKITDFGVSRENDDATMTAGIGTYRWMAPEVLQDGHYTESADIFSFGVILAELS
ncbi:kinase, partial [Thraustotheca clavata]